MKEAKRQRTGNMTSSFKSTLTSFLACWWGVPVFISGRGFCPGWTNLSMASVSEKGVV